MKNHISTLNEIIENNRAILIRQIASILHRDNKFSVITDKFYALFFNSSDITKQIQSKFYSFYKCHFDKTNIVPKKEMNFLSRGDNPINEVFPVNLFYTHAYLTFHNNELKDFKGKKIEKINLDVKEIENASKKFTSAIKNIVGSGILDKNETKRNEIYFEDCQFNKQLNKTESILPKTKHFLLVPMALIANPIVILFLNIPNDIEGEKIKNIVKRINRKLRTAANLFLNNTLLEIIHSLSYSGLINETIDYAKNDIISSVVNSSRNENKKVASQNSAEYKLPQSEFLKLILNNNEISSFQSAVSQAKAYIIKFIQWDGERNFPKQLNGVKNKDNIYKSLSVYQFINYLFTLTNKLKQINRTEIISDVYNLSIPNLKIITQFIGLLIDISGVLISFVNLSKERKEQIQDISIPDEIFYIKLKLKDIRNIIFEIRGDELLPRNEKSIHIQLFHRLLLKDDIDFYFTLLFCEYLSIILLPFEYFIEVKNDTEDILEQYERTFNNERKPDAESQQHELAIEFQNNHFYYKIIFKLGESVNFDQNDIQLNISEVNNVNIELINQALSNLFKVMHRQWTSYQESVNDKRKNAVAVVMARNMSHNIGSHVLTKDILKKLDEENYKDHIENKQKDIIISTLCLIYQKLNDEQRKKFDQVNLNRKHEIRRFLTYLRHRMLFHSEISYAFPAYSIPCDFEEVMNNFMDQKVLLYYISGTDNPVSFPTYKNLIINKCSTENSRLQNISFPGGMIGQQAFFVILENIIRNFYKHTKESERIKSYPIHLIEINRGEIGDRYYKFTIATNTKISNDSFHMIQSLMDDDILEQEEKKNKYTIRKKGWGIIEMKAAACFLRRIDLEEIDALHDVPLLEVSKKQTSGRLAYSFYLKKSKEILIYDPSRKFTPDNYQKIKELNNQGVFFTDKIDTDENETHNFIINIPGDDTNFEENDKDFRSLQKIKCSIPYRYFVLKNSKNKQVDCPLLTEDDIKMIINIGISTEDKLNLIYKIWTEFLRDPEDSRYFLIKCENTPNDIALINDNIIEPVSTDRENIYIDIIFDYHGQYFDTYIKELKNIGGYQSAYYEHCPEISPFRTILKAGNFTKYFKYEVLEAFLIKVAIIDERFQADIKNKLSIGNNNYIDKKQYYEAMNLFVFDNDYYDLNSTIDAVEFFIALKKWLLDFGHDFQFLIIHVGIIEKIFDKTDEFLNELEQKVLNNSKTEIILTSERGTPDGIPFEYRFLHFSNLNLSAMSKVSLVKSILGSREKSEKWN